MSDERSEIYAAMAADDDNEAKPQPRIDDRARTVEAIVDGRKVTLPTVAYVRQLEQMLTQLNGEVKALRREVARASVVSRSNRTAVHSHNSRLQEMARQMDRKIDRRDD